MYFNRFAQHKFIRIAKNLIPIGVSAYSADGIRFNPCPFLCVITQYVIISTIQLNKVNQFAVVASPRSLYQPATPKFKEVSFQDEAAGRLIAAGGIGILRKRGPSPHVIGCICQLI